MKIKTTMTRRRLLAGASLMVFGPTAAPRIGRAQQAQWVYKYANNLQETHPMNIRAREMAATIKQDTNGRFDLQIFPSSQLGSDTDTLSQIRSGGVEFFTLSGLILSTPFQPRRSTVWDSHSPITTPCGRRWTEIWAPISARKSPRPT